MKLRLVASPASNAGSRGSAVPLARSRVVASALASVLGLAVLTGCGAGQVSQTASQSSVVNGYQGSVGDVAVRDASIAFSGQLTGPVYRAGQSAPLELTLVNVGAIPDTLVSVSSPWAASAQIGGDGVIGGGRAVRVGNGLSGSGASGSSESSGSSEASALADKTISITLVGLKGDLLAGMTYPVTFVFQRGGVLDAELPIGYPTGRLAVRGASS